MKNLLLVIIIFMAAVEAPSLAFADGVACVSKKGAIAIRKRCKRGESRLSMNSLRSGIASELNRQPFSWDGCYQKTFKSGNFFADAWGVVYTTCNAPASEFVMDSSFAVTPAGDQSNKPFLQQKILLWDDNGKHPIGVELWFLQAKSSGGTFQADVSITCCKK